MLHETLKGCDTFVHITHAHVLTDTLAVLHIIARYAAYKKSIQVKPLPKLVL